MGLLEYQAMPSLRDGWLCRYISYITAAGNSISSQLGSSRATGTVRKRQVIRPVHHVQNYTCRVTLLQLARRAAVLVQPSSLRTHWVYLPFCWSVHHNFVRDGRHSEGVHPPPPPGWADFSIMMECTPEVAFATLCVLCGLHIAQPTPLPIRMHALYKLICRRQ